MSDAFVAALIAYSQSCAANREPSPKPCSARLASGDWCLLAPGHEGECAAALPARLAVGTNRLVMGLMRCPVCGAMAKPMRGHMSVHYASAVSVRPCVNSWPKNGAK